MAYSREQMVDCYAQLQDNPAYHDLMEHVFTNELDRLKKDYFNMDFTAKEQEKKHNEIQFLQKIESKIKSRLSNTK